MCDTQTFILLRCLKTQQFGLASQRVCKCGGSCLSCRFFTAVKGKLACNDTCVCPAVLQFVRPRRSV